MALLWGLKAFYLCNYLSIWDCLRVSTLTFSSLLFNAACGFAFGALHFYDAVD